MCLCWPLYASPGPWPLRRYVQMLLESRLGVDPLDKSGTMYSRHARTLGEDGWELIWISVNSSSLSKSQASYNSDDRLTRAELLEVLVRAAIDSKPVDAMARCVNEICEDLLEVLSKAPVIRTSYIYAVPIAVPATL